MVYIVSDELYHHGVKGMKWGVRKKRPTSGHGKSTTAHKTVAKAFDGDKKSISKASDDELNTYLKRMELEKRVLSLQKEMTALTTSPAAPKKVSAGKKFVSSLWANGIQPGINDAAKATVSTFLKKQLFSALNLPANERNNNGNSNQRSS